MSEQELMDLIRKTILEWAMEEHLANQDYESHMTLHDRYHESAQTFMKNAREELDRDLGSLRGLPV